MESVHSISKNGKANSYKPQQTGFRNIDLMNFYNQIFELKTTLIFHLLKGRINDFNSKNNVRYMSLQDKVKALQQKHFEFDGEKVKTEMIQLLTADGFPDATKEPEQKVVCKEGFTMSDYDKAYGVLMSQDCTIEF